MGGPGGLPSRFWRKFKQFWVIFGQINVGTKIEPKYCQRTKSVTKKLSEPKKLHKEPNSSFLVPLLPSLASLDCDLHRFRYSFTHSTFHNECANSLICRPNVKKYSSVQDQVRSRKGAQFSKCISSQNLSIIREFAHSLWNVECVKEYVNRWRSQ